MQTILNKRLRDLDTNNNSASNKNPSYYLDSKKAHNSLSKWDQAPEVDYENN